MKVGNIVICVRQIPPVMNGELVPVLNHTYTIREVITPTDRNEVYFRFEEIINQPIDYYEGFYEICFRNIFFREIEFPPAIEAEINEALTAPVKEHTLI